MKKYEIANFKQLHQNIVISKARAELAFYEYCKALNDMKESKAYKTAGYETFADYTKENFGIEKTQAYVYANLAVKYSKEFLQENGKIGTAKLDLISKLPEDEAQEFLNNNNVESISVKQLKRTLASYKDKKESVNTEEIDNDYEEPIIEIIMDEISINSIGDFIKAKRMDKGFSQKELSEQIGISAGNLGNIECNRRSVVNKPASFYNKLIEVLELNNEDIQKLYEWADKDMFKKSKISSTISNYLATNDYAAMVLRQAANNNISKELWDKFYKMINAIPGGTYEAKN